MERPPPPLHRKRRRVARDAAPTREDVLLLLQRCRPLDRQQRAELQATYCRAWGAFRRLARHASAPLALDTHETETAATAEANKATVLEMEALEALARLRETVRVDWRSRVHQASAVLLDAFLRQTEALATANDIAALVLWAFVLHDTALWRLGDVLVQLVHDDGDADDWWSDAVRAVLDAPAQRLLATASDEHNAPRWCRLSSHDIIDKVVETVIDLAFDSSVPSTRNDPSHHRVSAAARQALNRLSASTSSPFSMHSLSVVSRLCAQRLMKDRDSTRGTSDAHESLRFFLRGQLEMLLRARIERPQRHDDIKHQAAFLSDCLRSIALHDVAQIVCQQWMNDRLERDSDARDRLASVLSNCVSIESDLKRHVLAAAHDQAADALAQSDAGLLRATLELVACVAPATDYALWCRCHLGAAATQVTAATPNDDRCLRCRTSATSQSAHCSLVQSKRQLQFLVAFLLELDRPPTDHERPQRRYSHPRADHVLAHLSAVKTHQTAPTGAAVGELLADFCSTTRLRHVQLQSREQHEDATTLSNSNDSSHDKIDVAVSRRLSLESASSVPMSNTSSNGSTTAALAGTKASVREMVAAFREQSGKLPSQVTQWRMFQPQAWRQRLLPCCLDVESWTSECSSDPNFLAPWIGLVTQLAQHNMVSATEFSAFLERIERWTQAEQQRLHKTQQRRRRRRRQTRRPSTTECEDSIDWLRQLVERFVALENRDDDDNRDDALASYREAQWECVTDAFVVAFEDIVEQRDDAQRDSAITTVQSIVIDQFLTRSTSSTAVFLHRHVLLWVRLLSSDGDATSSTTSASSSDPLARMAVMDAYCRLLTARLASARSSNDSSSRVDVMSALALGCLLGLLSSLPFCEKMAARWTREAEREALGVIAVAVLEPEQQHSAILSRVTLTSAFVAAFLRGLSTQSPAQTGSSSGVLERVWTTELREFLVWLAHHVEWTASQTRSDVVIDGAVYSVVRELLSVRWFQTLTSTSENVRSVLQWKRFWDLELHVAFEGVQELSLVRRTRDRMETLMLSRRPTEVSVKDVLVWIAQATMTTASTAEHPAPVRLVALFQDLWTRQSMQASSPTTVETVASASVQKLIESSLRLLNAIPPSSGAHAVSRVAIECLGALLDTNERRIRHATPLKTVVDWLEAIESQVSQLDWSDVPLAVVLCLQDPLSETSVFRLPAQCVLHWTRDWDRSVSALQRWGSSNAASASSDSASAALGLLLASSRSFLERIGVSVTGTLQIPPRTTRRLSSSAVRSHLGLFKWSLRLGLISPRNSRTDDVQHQLHRHELLAATLLTALCERETLATVAQSVATQCLLEWIASVEATDTTDEFDAQMALLHVVASLCADLPSVGRHVLSFKPSASRASVSQFPATTQGHAASTTEDSHAWFVFLLASMAQSLGRLELLMAHHPSVWVNAVVDAACRLLETETKTEPTTKRSVLRVLATTDALQRRLGCVLERVLRFAIDRQLDLLDPTAVSRLQPRLPHLSTLLQAVPVLCLDSGLCLTGEDAL